MAPIRVLLADDHQIIRDGIKALLHDAPEVHIVAEAENGKRVLDFLTGNQVDLVIMDINMPEMNGIEATQAIMQQFPSVPVLSLSMHDEVEYISKMLQAGANGYILKSSGKHELINAIKKVSAGEKYFSSDVSYTMMMNYIGGGSGNQSPAGSRPNGGGSGKYSVQLTKREIEIIRLIAGEMTNQEISDRLSISPRTVDTHRRNLLQKLGVKNTAGLVRYAIQHNLLEN